MGGKWLSTKMLLLLTVLLHTSFAFCPDGCACDEDLLHVTCLRSKLEVNFAFFTLEKCFDLSLKRVWWLLFHSTCKKQSALAEQDKIHTLKICFLYQKVQFADLNITQRYLNMLTWIPDQDTLPTQELRLCSSKYIDGNTSISLYNSFAIDESSKITQKSKQEAIKHKFLVVSVYVNTKRGIFMNFSLKLHKNKTILTQPDQWPVTTRLQCKV